MIHGLECDNLSLLIYLNIKSDVLRTIKKRNLYVFKACKEDLYLILWDEIKSI